MRDSSFGNSRVVEVVAVATERQYHRVSHLRYGRPLKEGTGDEVACEIIVSRLVLENVRPTGNVRQRRQRYGVELVLACVKPLATLVRHGKHLYKPLIVLIGPV